MWRGEADIAKHTNTGPQSFVHIADEDPRVQGDCGGDIGFGRTDVLEESERGFGFGGGLEVDKVFGRLEGLRWCETAGGDEEFLGDEAGGGCGGGAVQKEAVEGG